MIIQAYNKDNPQLGVAITVNGTLKKGFQLTPRGSSGKKLTLDRDITLKRCSDNSSQVLKDLFISEKGSPWAIVSQEAHLKLALRRLKGVLRWHHTSCSNKYIIPTGDMKAVDYPSRMILNHVQYLERVAMGLPNATGRCNDAESLKRLTHPIRLDLTTGNYYAFGYDILVYCPDLLMGKYNYIDSLVWIFAGDYQSYEGGSIDIALAGNYTQAKAEQVLHLRQRVAGYLTSLENSGRYWHSVSHNASCPPQGGVITHGNNEMEILGPCVCKSFLPFDHYKRLLTKRENTDLLRETITKNLVAYKPIFSEEGIALQDAVKLVNRNAPWLKTTLEPHPERLTTMIPMKETPSGNYKANCSFEEFTDSLVSSVEYLAKGTHIKPEENFFKGCLP